MRITIPKQVSNRIRRETLNGSKARRDEWREEERKKRRAGERTIESKKTHSFSTSSNFAYAALSAGLEEKRKGIEIGSQRKRERSGLKKRKSENRVDLGKERKGKGNSYIPLLNLRDPSLDGLRTSESSCSTFREGEEREVHSLFRFKVKENNERTRPRPEESELSQ